MTLTAMLTAVAVILIFVNFSIFPQAAFLKYDFGDIPILIVTFAFGPLYGFISTVIVSVIQALFLSADGWFGGLMHIVATSALLVPAGLFYKFSRKKQDKDSNIVFNRAVIAGLSLGCICMTVSMIAFNFFLDPIFYGMPQQAVVSLLPWIGLFNLIKSVANSVITLIIYKYIFRIINKL